MASSVTLIFRKLEDKWSQEHPINLISAIFSRSNFTHVELSIGEDSGQRGEIANVVRIYNDEVGVEVCQRTGMSPQYVYLEVGCQQKSVTKMLNFAAAQQGKPFSMGAMVRSIVYPRTTNEKNYFCAELVARTLQIGGLFPPEKNPGAETPETLFRRFKSVASVTGNPYMLRQIQMRNSVSMQCNEVFNEHSLITEDLQFKSVPINLTAGVCNGGTYESVPTYDRHAHEDDVCFSRSAHMHSMGRSVVFRDANKSVVFR